MTDTEIAGFVYALETLNGKPHGSSRGGSSREVVSMRRPRLKKSKKPKGK
ncbi:hypothetical protein PAN31117_04677 [Pandoraea anapnoica]|uniref:Uncharacterized protein n=1 Tax=Pandoraea anapnoica TaxID=2508301 RepID=A0A5E5AKK6_9BURK|nr:MULTISPECIES: hypothetical protein [Pandoraea]VVE14672.1 hypothetical protein PIN31009_02813 [Pandoraea iniqua]VVE73332.1 hypothetical protein PAN31117_04677 [Pandoraea anapnoica]